MNSNLKLTLIAQSIALILSSGSIMPGVAETVIKDTACNGQSSSCSGINWYETQRLWGLRAPRENVPATLTGTPDNVASIYFSSESLRSQDESQTLTLSGTNLTDHVINTSYGGTATVNLLNDSQVDVIETGNGGKNTTTIINVDNSVMHGGKYLTYDDKNKSWLMGIAIYNDAADTGDNTIVIKNNSVLTGSIYTGGAGNQAVTLQDSALTGAGIMVYGAADNTLALDNSTVDTRNPAVNNSYSSLSAGDNAINATGQTTTLSANNSTLIGNIIINDTAQSALTLTQSTVQGDMRINQGTVSLDATTVEGNISAANGGTLSLGTQTPSFSNRFSGFDTLIINGATQLVEGLTNAQVGNSLTVKGAGILTSAVNLTGGSLTIDSAKLLADTIALSDSALLTLNNSGLRTGTAQLFTHALDATGTTAEAGAFNATGQNITFNNSTLSLDDPFYNLQYVKSVHALMRDGNTLLMEGQLIDGDTVTDQTTVAEAASTGATLAQVDVLSAKNHLLIGGSTVEENTEATLQGFGAASLQLGAKAEDGANQVTIQNGQSLILTGAHGGALISVQNAPEAAVAVNVDDGTLQLGVQTLPDAAATLNGSVNIGEAGALWVAAGSHSITGDGITSSGEVTVSHAASLASDVTLENQSTLNVLGNLQADSLRAGQDSVISVGDADSAGRLVASNVQLNGARLFLDPAWQPDSTIDTASQAMLGGDNVNGLLTVGQNAVLVLGDTSFDNTRALFAESGQRWQSDAVTAAVSIITPQTLDALNGGLRVDGSLTRASSDKDAVANHAAFADNSLLMVNGSAATDGAALTANGGTLEVADKAKLYLSDAKVNRSYTITEGFTTATLADNGWSGDNLLVNRLLNAQRSENAGTVTITTTAKAAADVLPGVVLPHTLDALMESGSNSTTSDFAGIRFLSRVLDASDVAIGDAVRTINSAAQIATAGGVQNALLTTGAAAAKAIQDHNTLANAPSRIADGDANVWVQLLYGNNHNRDFSAGGMDYGYNTDFYGLITGADITRDVGEGQLRSGVAFHAGNGKVNSAGDFSHTKNDFNFFGASLYQNWRLNDFNVMADVGYSASNNDLQQRVPGYLDMGSKIKGSVDAQLFTVGLLAEYRVQTDLVDVIPYAGARYNQLTTKSFTTKINNEAAFDTGKERQDIWQFPVGVRLNKTFGTDSGWAISPQADFAVVPVAGNTHAKTTLRTYGVSATDTMSAQIMDDTSFNGQLGVKAQKGNITWGVSYRLAASDHETGQAGIVSFNYAF